MDATSSLDHFSCPTYIISTGSAAGAVPLGVFVLSNETTSTVTRGLNLLKSVLPSHAFFNKGCEIGPDSFITDKLASQREALRMYGQMHNYYYVFFTIYKGGGSGCGKESKVLIRMIEKILCSLCVSLSILRKSKI